MARRLEFDALRGILLLMMTITHLPTRLAQYSIEMFGFVSPAEGFVFMSAFIAGIVYTPLLQKQGLVPMRRQIWRRALKLYGYHLALLAFAFTIAASYAVLSGRPALRNLLSFYFDDPTEALVGGPLLLYQPPLFDILPMYIMFLVLTPFILQAGQQERGWRQLSLLSALVWLFAQLDGRRLVYGAFAWVSGVRIPLEAAGSFDLFAWQLLWVGGLWLGGRFRAQEGRIATLSPRVLLASASFAALFFIWRHHIGGFNIDLGSSAALLDKWHLGTLRLINFAALSVLVVALVLPMLRWLKTHFLELLGQASLQAFSIHVLLCLASFSLVVDDDTPLNDWEEITVLVGTLSVMFYVAWWHAQRQRKAAQSS